VEEVKKAMGTSRIGGTLIPPGSHPSNQTGGKVYTPAASYPSKSDPTKGYTVCEVNDGTTSCGCMGWTRRNPPGGRTCRHTEDYELLLRPDWNLMNSGQSVPSSGQSVPQAQMAPEPVVQAVATERGGSLTDLLQKLDEDGMK